MHCIGTTNTVEQICKIFIESATEDIPVIVKLLCCTGTCQSHLKFLIIDLTSTIRKMSPQKSKNILERLDAGEVIIGDGSYCNTLEKRGYVKVQSKPVGSNEPSRILGKVLQSRRGPLLGPSPG